MSNQTDERVGIFDPKGKHNNPLTGEKYSENYKEWAKIWSTFPAYDMKHEIVRTVKNNQVTIITSATGSGKTVLVPKFTLHAYKYDTKIAITLPKQIIAKSAAAFSAETLDIELGKQIGYQYKGSPKGMRGNNAKLLYATDGTIVQHLLHDPKLEKFDCVIVDEAHERKVQIDFLLYLLRETLKLRPKFKLIIMSATIDIKLFKEYYQGFTVADLEIGSQTNYPIQSIFLEKPLEYREAVTQGFNIVKKIMREDDVTVPGAHDILFFVTSANEAFNICKKLHAHMVVKEINHNKVYCIEVFSGMDPEKQSIAQDKEAYKNEGSYSRKLVVATNVAESSLTIDGIKYVIDTGHELSAFYDPKIRAQKLDLKMITQAQAKQRMGRTGRTEPGLCYHMYTEKQFREEMEAFPLPDIRKTNISTECLRLLDKPNVNNVRDLVEVLSNFIEPPRKKYVKDAVLQLMQMGAVEAKQITPLGKLMAKIGIDPMTSLTLIWADKYDCFGSMLKIVAMISACKNHLNELFLLPTVMLKNREDLMADRDKFRRVLDSLTEKFNYARGKYKHISGDHLSILTVYVEFTKMLKKHGDDWDYVDDWCYDRFLKATTLFKARKYCQKYKMARYQIRDAKLDLQTDPEIKKLSLEDRLLACILIGFSLNRAVRSTKMSKKKQKEEVERGQKRPVYKTNYAGDLKIPISKTSYLTLYKSPPKKVVYNELFILKGSPDLNIVSKIPPHLDKLIT